MAVLSDVLNSTVSVYRQLSLSNNMSHGVLMLGVTFLIICFGLFGKVLSVLSAELENRQRLLRAFKQFPGEPKHWLFGHLHMIDPQSYIRIGVEWAAKYVHGFPVWYGPTRAGYECCHPMTVKALLSTTEPKDKWAYGFVKPWLGDGLLISNGPKWTRNRKLLTPGFHFEILKPYAKIFSDCAKVLVFNPYVQAVNEAAHLIAERFLNVFHHGDFIYYNFTRNGKKFKRSLQCLHEYSQTVIKERKAALQSRKTTGEVTKRNYVDFLDILLSVKDEDGKGLTDEEIQDEVDTFMFEGHDTTASGISWCLYNLAKHPEHQRKCQQEIDEFFLKKGDTDLKWDDLVSFPYLTMCIKESLRITPAVPMIGRDVTKPIELPDGRTFPKDTPIGINIYNLHHNKHVWDEPEKYDPSRFLPKNVQKRSPHAFVPFSAGPRNCIGQNFAMSEMKIVLSMVLHNFELSLDSCRPVKPMLGLVLQTVDGMHLCLRKRLTSDEAEM